MKSLEKDVDAPINVFPLSECMWCGQPRRAEKSEKTGRNFSVVRSDVASRLIARVLLSYTRLQFCSRNAVTWLKAKSFLFFFVPKTLLSGEKSAQRRRLPTKTIMKQREADIRTFPLFVLQSACTLRSQRQISADPLFLLRLSVMFG